MTRIESTHQTIGGMRNIERQRTECECVGRLLAVLGRRGSRTVF